MAEMKVAELTTLAGRELAPTAWIEVTQQRIDAFARCTDDHQFIHVDAQRARRESPFGSTIAHGFLLLSLVAGHPPPDFPRFSNLAFALNYGLDRVRLLSPVRSGARVRLRTKVVSVTEKEPGRFLVKQEKTMEIEGGDKPALVAEQLSMFLERPG